ncbi:MAG: PKD domain-containing protein [Chitinophagales bacterium]|nr:PKD domain-containing protein [Chitinophagales bacterium]
MENTLGSPPDTLLVSMSSRIAATATVSIPLNGWTQTVNIPANTSVSVGIPKSLAMASGCGAKLPRGCRIQATEKISAYALNFQGFSADASLLIPTTTLGDKYYLNTYRENYSNSRQTQMLIVAAYPNSTIQITPTVATSCGNAAGVPFQINLNQGEVYNLESAGDLTGTYVQSIDNGQGCKKFVLLSGNFCTAVGGQCCCDHLFDINFHNESWGKNYILPNLRTRNVTRFRVVAQQNGTQVSVNGGPVQNLNAGQFYQFDLTANGSVTSNNPIAVMQLSMSGDADGTSADPFMITLGPNEQTMKEITFNTLFNSGNSPTYYATIVTKTNSTGLLTLDGAPVAGFTPVASNPAYSIASPNVAFGSHTLRSDSGFLAYIYEYASYESFGYSAGANLTNLFASFEYASSRHDSIFCPGDTVFFQGVGDPSILSYEWDFGDGDTSKRQNPKHVYTTLGDFTVNMIIQRQNSCDKDTIPGKVKILGPPVTNVPDDTICIGTSITVSVNSPDSIRWSTGDTTSSITLWPSATTSYSVYTKNVACAGMPDTFTVNIRDPKVDFTTSPQCFGNPIRFTPFASTSLQSFSWDYGDGNFESYNSATLNYRDHTYTAPGNYSVTLAIQDSTGCKDTIVKNVSVFPLLNQNFTVGNICLNGIASIVNNTTVVSGSVHSQWNWGDGSAIDTSFSPTHLYATTGSFDITYIAATDSGCSDTLVRQIIVYDTAAVSFTANDTCLGNAIQFVNTSSAPPGSTPLWYFGDGTQSSDTSPVHSYTTAGIFNVTAIALTPFGCNDTVIQQVEVFPNPIPNFVSDSVCDGTTIQFVNSSSIASGTYTSAWNFGDGANDISKDPSHLYASTGNYNVVLTLTSNYGCVDSAQKVALVSPNPTAAFTLSDVCNDSTLSATNTSSVSGGTINYVWKWGDGNSSTAVPATHNYNSSGTYTVTVTTTTNFGCADSTTQTATVILGGNLDFSAPTVCNSTATNFTDQTVLKTGTTVQNYTWNFGDGNTATGASATNTYSTAGNYNAKLVLDYGNNCFDSVIKQVTVEQNPTAAFTANTVCERNYTNFNNNSSPAGFSSLWNFADGNTDTTLNPSHLYASNGTYLVKLVVTTAAQCTDSITDTISVLPVGKALFTVLPVCLGEPTQFVNNIDTVTYPVSNFDWNLGNGTTSNNSNPQLTYSTSGNFNILLIANFANGCADTAYGSTSVFEIPAFTYQTKNVSCFAQNDGEITLNSTAGKAPFNFIWSPALSNNSVQQNLAAGDYFVTFSDANNCSDTLSAIITQPDSLSLYVALDSISCFGRNDGKLRAFVTGGTPQYSYVWSNGINISENKNLSEGNYQLTVTDANLCELIRNILLPNPARFNVQLKEIDTIQLGESITLQPTYNYSNITNWQWTPATALNCIDCENPVANPYNDIVYTVYATTEKGCYDSAFTEIIVEHTPVVYVPNLFTPNGDGLNDVAMVYANNVRDLNFLIFNRWGEKVYEGHNITEGWNGIYANKLQNPETYVYVVTITFLDNKTVTKTGSVTLVK